MKLESSKVTVPHAASYIYDALDNVQNFEKLMPDSIAKFEVLDAETFIFGLKGMPEIKLRKKSQTPHSQIVLGATSDKLPFTLTGNLVPLNDSTTEVQLLFEGEFNPMMAMMVKGPIGNFIEALASNINKL